MNLLTFIGLCVSGAIFLFALIVLCVHVCAISIISFILALLICLVYTYFFVVDHDVLKLLKGEKKEEDVKEVEEVKDEPKAEEIKDVKDAEEEDTAIAETEAEAEKEYESEKDDTLEEIEAKEKAHEALTLKDSLVLAKATTSSHKFTKKYVADYLRTKDIVEVNERENYTRTGLPLADTHYVDGKEGKKCFVYVYETEGSIILLAKMDSKYAEKLQEKHSQINLSAFPKQKNTWYSLIIDDTYTNEEFEGILDELIGEVKEDAGMSLKESIALAKASTSHSFSKKYVCDYLQDKPNVEVNTRENYTKTGLPLADTHYVEKDGKKICFAYIYEIEGSIILLGKMKSKYANALKKKHPNVTLSAFPKQADTWYSLIIDDTYTKVDFDKIIDDLIEQA
jgi:predicted DNA-binding protein (MmcQ/YjbR family)